MGLIVDKASGRTSSLGVTCSTTSAEEYFLGSNLFAVLFASVEFIQLGCTYVRCSL